MAQFILSTSSTTDMPPEFFSQRSVPVAFFRFVMEGRTYNDDMGQSMPIDKFYRLMEEGAVPTTSQLNENDYIEILEPLLRGGDDVLHIELSSGISGAYNSGKIAEEELRKRYPERKLYFLDSLGASAGFGLLVEAVADLRDAGKSIDEAAEWVEKNRLRVHHWFFTSELIHLKRGGRVSAPAAFFGSLLNICPLLNVSVDGKLIPRVKVRGKKHVSAAAVEKMKRHADGGTKYSGRVLISNSAVSEDAEYVAELIRAEFPDVESIRICDIGTVIGSHTGPGTVALFFWGDERTD